VTAAELNILSANCNGLEVNCSSVFLLFETMELLFVQEVDVSWCRSVTDDWVIALKEANKDLVTVSAFDLGGC
jgi:hypothetical protein